KPQEMSSLIQSLEKEELLKISQEITNVEIKKEFVQIVLDSHSEAISILLDILYEVPIKVNKHVFSLLVSEKKFDELNQFIQNVMEQNKNYPEIFLWIAKSILTKSWNYEWLKISIKDLSLKLFRFLKPLVKIEPKGTKLKNSAMDIIFGSKNATLKDIISNSDNDTLRKFYVLFKEVSYINDPDKDKFLNLITESNPGFQWEDTVVVEEDEEDDINLYLPESGVLVTRKAYNERKEKFEYLVNVEMPENSRDIGEAQEKGDLRENAEYKAAMERQVQLRAELTKLEAELKSAKIIDLSDVKTSRIHIGCRVKLKNSETQEELNYAILGPWDTDTEKSIISYQSPLGMALLGKKQGDSAIVDFDGSKTEFLILEISR
ncbi:MAG: transcription elongation factor GreA, partial [Leptospiraceae bacterium]|nr:transcription elongation factor GreA [Leptospiraceae bacterium]